MLVLVCASNLAVIHYLPRLRQAALAAQAPDPPAAAAPAAQAPALPAIPERPSELEDVFNGAPPGARRPAASTPSPGEPAPAQPATVAPQPAPARAASAPAPAPAAAADGAALSEIGAPSDARGLTRLGAQTGLLSKLVAAAVNHPAALRLLLNNKTLVNAYFSRESAQRNCSSGEALKSYMMNGSDPSGVSEEISIARGLLSHPDAAAAMAGTEFSQRLLACPSVGQLSNDRGAMLQVAMANPSLLSLVADPNAMSALSSNPQALALLGGVQSSIGAGPSK
jgi:hypothetical protein